MRCPYCNESASEFDVKCPSCGMDLQVSDMFSSGSDEDDHSLSSGFRMGQYRIQQKLGQGGMGAVYKAWDHALDRPAAIKIITLESMGDANIAEMVIMEARAASALNHPHIVTIYDVARGGEANHIAMEFVEGNTLKELLKDGPLPLPKALTYASQIASGLVAAHEKGVIHRDIKPHNIMIDTRDHVKILDFGVAKVSHDLVPNLQGVSRMKGTRAGQLKGTMAFMSPEQARGESVDASSDIFSFGILLYIMTTGKHPFDGSNNKEVMEKILHEQPKPLHAFLPNAPKALQALVDGCLEKESSRRISNMAEVERQIHNLLKSENPTSIRRRAFVLGLGGAALGGLGLFQYFRKRGQATQRWVEPGQVLAFLPFRMLNSDPSLKILGDGLSRDFYRVLARRVEAEGGVWVPPEETSFAPGSLVESLKNKAGAHWVVTGHIQSFGFSTLLTLVLVEAESLRQVTSEEISFEIKDIHLVRERIAEAICSLHGFALCNPLDPKERPRNARCYREYLAGLFYLGGDASSWLQDSLDALADAHRLDPNFRPARMVTGLTLLNQAELHGSEKEKVLTYFQENQDLADVSIQGRLLRLVGDLPKAITLMQEHLANHGQDIAVQLLLARLLAEHGDPAQAETLCTSVLEVMPQNLDAWIVLGDVALGDNRRDDALKVADQILKRAPANDWALAVKSSSY